MVELRINKDLVTHIKIHDWKKSHYYFKPALTTTYFFGLYKETEREGYYLKGDRFEWFEFTVDEVKKAIDVVDKNEVLWYKPKIEIFTQKEKIKTFYFNTVEQAKDFCNTNFPNVNFYVEKD